LGEFMLAWLDFEKVLSDAALALKIDMRGRAFMPLQVAEALSRQGFISPIELNEINQTRKIRNEVVHGILNYKEILKPDMVKKLQSLSDEMQMRLYSASENRK